MLTVIVMYLMNNAHAKINVSCRKIHRHWPLFVLKDFDVLTNLVLPNVIKILNYVFVKQNNATNVGQVFV